MRDARAGSASGWVMATQAHSTKARDRLAVGIVPLPNFTLTAFAGFVDVLRLAADEGDRSRPRACTWTVLGAELRRPIRASCGVEFMPQDTYGDPARFDYLVVVGGLLPSPDDRMLTRPVLAFLRDAYDRGGNLIGICTGSLALAEAGLLRKGARCCVSWYHYPDLIERHPDLLPVADQLWVQDGRIATCAGGLAATDLAAALVQKHIGHSAAQKSLHILLSDGPRLAGAAQPQPPNTVRVADARVRRTMLLLEQNLSTPLLVDELAATVAISTRQLQRLFRRELGVSLQIFGRDLRVYYAAWLMIHTPGRLSDIAAQCGFSDAAHFSRTFRATFGQSPIAAQRLGGDAMRRMVERWWPYGPVKGTGAGLPSASANVSANTGAPRTSMGADRRPYP